MEKRARSGGRIEKRITEDKTWINLRKIFIYLCEAVIPYAPAVAVVALLLIGGMFAIPSDESRQKAKKALGGVAIGMFFIVGAVYIGKWYTSKLVF